VKKITESEEPLLLVHTSQEGSGKQNPFEV
jgi:hypothetical protein